MRASTEPKEPVDILKKFIELSDKYRNIFIQEIEGEVFIYRALGRGEYKDILDLADVIVDGRYEEDKRDLSIAFRGSTNQRIWRKSTNEFNDTIWRYDRE